MKKILKTSKLSIAVTTVLFASYLASGLVQAGTIVGTAHDFQLSGWSGGEICVACHTPHNSDLTVVDAPLWNHTVTGVSFTMYTGPGTLDGVVDGQPTGTSKLCLSCHDGATAVDSFGGNTGGTVMSGPSAVGFGADSLTNDHPISITYDTALAGVDLGLHDPSATEVTIGFGGDKARTGSITDMMLSGGKVQCTSCHDVHNGAVGPGTDNAPLLKVTKDGSAICLTCHNK